MQKNQQGREYDVLIAGSGAAGIMAALTVSRAGLRCCVLEAGSNAAASNGARAGGPALAETVCQQREDVALTAEELYQHMYRFSRGTVNAGLLRRALSKGSLVEQIFTENGVEMELLPDTYGVGFRARHLFRKGGEKRWQPLVDELVHCGGEIFYNRKAVQLLMEDGRAIGVAAEKVEMENAGEKSEAVKTEGEAFGEDGKPEREEYRAKAVILATGGYLGSEEMQREHFGNIHVVPLGNCLSDGTGIRMALEAGGMEDRNWGICANEFGGANHRLLDGGKRFSTNLIYAICGGLLVDREGRRFMNEQYLSDEPLSIGGEITVRAGKFYAVLDEAMYQGIHGKTVYEFYGKPEAWHAGKSVHSRPLRFCSEDLDEDAKRGWAVRSDTLSGAAAAFSLTELEKTVEQYNRLCETGRDAQFGKAGYLLKPLNKPPYYIFEYEPSAWCTFGGVKTDEYCRLLNRNQEVVPGVFVAGVDNGSCYMTPYYDNEGAALGLALTTGVVAGETAVRELAQGE